MFILESVPDGKKRLARISEVFYDEERNSVFANDLMRWEEEQGAWSYNDRITGKLMAKMHKKNARAMRSLMQELGHLAAMRPMADPLKESLKSKIVLNE
ncbi:hypothetical protein D3C73_1432590 [compost metagenome]